MKNTAKGLRWKRLRCDFWTWTRIKLGRLVWRAQKREHKAYEVDKIHKPSEPENMGFMEIWK